MEIQDKVVLITGASAGIGLVTARRFAEAGAKLALVARSGDLLAKLHDELMEQGIESIAITADLREPADIKRAVNQTVQYFGHVDILINNAGQAAAGTVAEVNPDDFRQIIDLNIFGPLLLMQAVIPIMREHGGGIIINVSSMVSKMHIPSLSAYAATKSALNMISDTARVELAPENIRVISVFPRLTATDFQKNSLSSSIHRRLTSNSPMPADTPDLVAEKILNAAINEPEEQYMTD